MQDGTVSVNVEFDDVYYYKILSDLIGIPINGEYQLISTIKSLPLKSRIRDGIPSRQSGKKQGLWCGIASEGGDYH